MALKQPSARSRLSSRVRSGIAQSGVVHVNVRHTDRYTVVGNHLAQHHALSLVAIGLAVHIQSLPTGAKVGIKVLTDRFPEGEVRIGTALRELEEYGYLERSRVRTDKGRILTRTVSYNQPRGSTPEPPSPPPLPPVPPPPPPEDRAPVPPPEPVPVVAPEPEPVVVPEPVVPVTPPPPPPPPTPPPTAPALQEAVDLLARLRVDDARLLLPERDVRQLAPGVSAWLQRGAEPEAVRQVLANDLPADLRHPARLLAHRLDALIPPHLPAAPVAQQARRRPDPLQNCDGCERAFRAPVPGRCRDCPEPDPKAAAA